MKTLIFALLFISQSAFCNEPTGEVRQYLTGTLVGIQQSYSGDLFNYAASAGINIAYHGDQGVHQSETGAGIGGGGSIKKPLNEFWDLGLRLDIWAMHIWWSDPGASGQTHFILLQPTVELARKFIFLNRDFTAEIAGGVEVNTFHRGESTGQGAIGLIGLAFNL